MRQEFGTIHGGRATDLTARDANLFGDQRPGLSPELLRLTSEGKVNIIPFSVGTQGKEALLQAISGGGRTSSRYAIDLVARSTDKTLTEPTEVTAGIVRAGDLVPGVQYPTTDQVFSAAKEKGLEELTVQEALALIAEMTDQPKGDVLVAGHKPVLDSDGDSKLLVAGHVDDGPWLNGHWADPDNEWLPAYLFAFGLRK